MKNIKIIMPNIIVCIVLSLIAIILPIVPQNTISFIYSLCCFILFNIIGCFINNRLIENNLKKDLNNIPTFYLYIIFDILLTLLLFVQKIISISINLAVILTMILFTAFFVMAYLLINAKKYINNHDEEVYKKTCNSKKWITSIEYLLTKEERYNKELNNLYDILKYMDVTSNKATNEIDNEINELINVIEKKVELETINSIEKLLNKRKIILKNEKR